MVSQSQLDLKAKALAYFGWIKAISEDDKVGSLISMMAKFERQSYKRYVYISTIP